MYLPVRVDQAGVICKQEGIFRVNCMDCLDRTNVVQAAVARVVMEQQVRCSPQRNEQRFASSAAFKTQFMIPHPHTLSCP